MASTHTMHQTDDTHAMIWNIYSMDFTFNWPEIRTCHGRIMKIITARFFGYWVSIIGELTFHAAAQTECQTATYQGPINEKLQFVIRADLVQTNPLNTASKKKKKSIYKTKSMVKKENKHLNKRIKVLQPPETFYKVIAYLPYHSYTYFHHHKQGP